MYGLTAITVTSADVENITKAKKFYDTKNAIVLNGDYNPIGYTSWKDAISMVCVGKAEMVAMRDRAIHPQVLMPLVIRLVKTLRKFWKKEVPWSKQNTHVRDAWKCQYCGDKLNDKTATIDHVIPQAQGGKNGWLNTVCSCFDCNNRKEDRTPSQAKMYLKRQPYKPTISEFIQKDIEVSGGRHLLELVWQKMSY